jgi:hypothetical protein
MLLLGVNMPTAVLQRLEMPEGLMHYPYYMKCFTPSKLTDCTGHEFQHFSIDRHMEQKNSDTGTYIFG